MSDQEPKADTPLNPSAPTTPKTPKSPWKKVLQPTARTWHATPKVLPDEYILPPMPVTPEKPAVSPVKTPPAAEEPKKEDTPAETPKPEEPKTEEKPKDVAEPAEPPAINFFYHSPKNQSHGSFSPYSPHHIRLGNRTYATLAHLYWTIAFLPNREIVLEILRLSDIDHEASVIRLVKIANEYRSASLDNTAFVDKRLQIMHALQLLKFAQHSDLRKELLDTGSAKLIYAQPASAKIKAGEQGKNAGSDIPDFLLFYLRSLNSPTAAQDMGRLLHADDIWWGTDTTIDPEASMGNKLGDILMDLRTRFAQEDDKTLDLTLGLCTLAEISTSPILGGLRRATFPADSGHES